MREQKREVPDENQFSQVMLQNNRLWVFTSKSKILIKREMQADGKFKQIR